MARPSTRLGWVYDPAREVFTTPTRQIPLRHMAHCYIDWEHGYVNLPGPWTGWRLSGDRLLAPQRRLQRVSIRPHSAAEFLAWREHLRTEDEKRYGAPYKPQLTLPF